MARAMELLRSARWPEFQQSHLSTFRSWVQNVLMPQMDYYVNTVTPAELGSGRKNVYGNWCVGATGLGEGGRPLGHERWSAAHAHTHTCVCVCVHVCVRMRTCAYICTCTHAQRVALSLRSGGRQLSWVTTCPVQALPAVPLYPQLGIFILIPLACLWSTHLIVPTIVVALPPHTPTPHFKPSIPQLLNPHCSQPSFPGMPRSPIA